MHIYRCEWQNRLLAELSASQYEPVSGWKYAAAKSCSRAGEQRGEEISLPGRYDESEYAGESDGKWQSGTDTGGFTFSFSRR